MAEIRDLVVKIPHARPSSTGETLASCEVQGFSELPLCEVIDATDLDKIALDGANDTGKTSIVNAYGKIQGTREEPILDDGRERLHVYEEPPKLMIEGHPDMEVNVDKGDKWDKRFHWYNVLTKREGADFREHLFETNRELIENILIDIFPDDLANIRDKWMDKKYYKFWGFVISRMALKKEIGDRINSGKYSEDSSLLSDRNMISTFVFNIVTPKEILDDETLNEAISIYRWLGEKSLIPVSKVSIVLTSDLQAMAREKPRDEPWSDENDIDRILQEERYRQIIKRFSVTKGPWGNIIWLEMPKKEPGRGSWPATVENYIVGTIFKLKNSIDILSGEQIEVLDFDDLPNRYLNDHWDMLEKLFKKPYVYRTGNILVWKEKGKFKMRIMKSSDYSDSIVDGSRFLNNQEEESLGSTLGALQRWIVSNKFGVHRSGIDFIGDKGHARELSMVNSSDAQGRDDCLETVGFMSNRELSNVIHEFRRSMRSSSSLTDAVVVSMETTLLDATRKIKGAERADQVCASFSFLPMLAIGEGKSIEPNSFWDTPNSILWPYLTRQYPNAARRRSDILRVLDKVDRGKQNFVLYPTATVIQADEQASGNILDQIGGLDIFPNDKGNRYFAISVCVPFQVLPEARKEFLSELLSRTDRYVYGLSLDKLRQIKGIIPKEINVVATIIGVDGRYHHLTQTIPLDEERIEELAAAGFFIRFEDGPVYEFVE